MEYNFWRHHGNKSLSGKKTMLQGVEFICWNCIFSITSFQFPEVSHNFCMYFPKVLQSLTKSPKCNFPTELHMSRLQTTESVTTAGADWTRLTVNHHVDEKYGKLALDSIKKLGRENETKASYCFLIYSVGGGSNGTKAAVDWTSTENGTVPRRYMERLTLGMKSERLTVRNNNVPLQGQSKLRCLFFWAENFEGLQCQKVYCRTKTQNNSVSTHKL